MKRKKLSTVILIVVFFIGLSVLLYPTVSNYINTRNQTRAIASYENALSGMTQKDYASFWKAAEAYNKKLAASDGSFDLTDAQRKEYDRLLDPTGTGMMGYVEIKSIDVRLPIYHSIDDTVLEIGAGHIPGSSLPTGGGSTHCVLSGHRGLPSAKLFTDLDQLKTGDIFLLHIMDRTLAYAVDQTKIVLPEDTKDLNIAAGKDYCTLVTCTPYGVNTHRLLVRGHRVDNTDPQSVQAQADAVPIDPMLVASVAAAPILLVLLILLIRGSSRKRKTEKKKLRHGKDGG